MADVRRLLAQLNELRRADLVPATDSLADMEPHLRIVAEEEGLDPEVLVEEARR